MNKKYLEVKKQLMELIRTAEPGERLPGERELANDFGFSYMTIRRAVDELVRENFLCRKPRKGTFVVDTNERERTGNIGFFLYEKLQDGMASPYYSLLFSKLQDELNRHNYNFFFFTNPATLSIRDVDGIITTPFPEIEKDIIELSRYLPVVLYDNRIPTVDLPTVSIDNFNSFYHVAEYAIHLGHKRIGYLAGLLNSAIGLKRLAGFKTALENYGIECLKEYIVKGTYQFESGYESASQFVSLKPMPTFIVCANDVMAVGLLRGLSEKGIKVPEDVSLSGFDNVVLASNTHPSITTMGIDFQEVAVSIIEILLHRIDGTYVSSDNRILQTSLIKRESTIELID